MKVSKILATRMARRYHQQGLTLIELLVVLVILIALAGILIPQLPNVLQKTHASAAATNIPELNKRIQEYSALYGSQPAGLDNLAVSGTALINYLPDAAADGANAVEGLVTPGVLAADEAEALEHAGVTSVMPLHATSALLDTNDRTPTINPYSGAAAAIDATLFAAVVAQPSVQALLMPTSVGGDRFVAYGIGAASDLTGTVLSEAPFHFSESGTETVGNTYLRYLAVYQVQADGDILENARFVGVLAAHAHGLANVASHVEEFYEN
jgi:prepilin-type N-terminal cleavage/methylation domain-containing protein